MSPVLPYTTAFVQESTHIDWLLKMRSGCLCKLQYSHTLVRHLFAFLHKCFRKCDYVCGSEATFPEKTSYVVLDSSLASRAH